MGAHTQESAGRGKMSAKRVLIYSWCDVRRRRFFIVIDVYLSGYSLTCVC